MTYEQEYIFSQDGLQLNTAFWELEAPKALVCIIHGFGEHLGRYEHVAEFFVKNDFAVLAMDLRGHGKSEGLKGHARSLSHLLSDIEELLKLGRVRYNDLPMFLFGHSMGGNLVLNYVLSKPVQELTGFVASSPWLDIAFKPPKWKLVLGNFFARTLPRFRQSNDLNPDDLSKIKEVGERYSADPLVNLRISAGLFGSINESSRFIQDHVNDFKLDGLVYHGEADPIIDFNLNENLFKDHATLDWKKWPGVLHEPHNDSEQKEVLQSVLEWLEKKLK